MTIFKPLAVMALVIASACASPSPTELAATELRAGMEAAATGQSANAVVHYEACLGHDPQNRFCLYNLGVHAGKAGRVEEAADYYHRALALDATFPEPLFNLAVIERDAGRMEQAAGLFRQYVLLVPADAEGHLALGLVLRRLGNLDEAEVELSVAKALNPALAIPDLSR